ncbi:MAG: YeeE/YedE family protein [Pseudomonadota bacterium]
MKGWPLPLLSGALFALGLSVSGMTQPAKVIGFLDVGGQWDPSLMFVMAGAVAVYFVGDRLIRRKTKPLYAATFSRPAAAKIDLRLLGGAAIFGVGWGLSGFCPGPALVSLGAGVTSALWFVPAALVGMLLHQRLTRAPSAADG